MGNALVPIPPLQINISPFNRYSSAQEYSKPKRPLLQTEEQQLLLLQYGRNPWKTAFPSKHVSDFEECGGLTVAGFSLEAIPLHPGNSVEALF